MYLIAVCDDDRKVTQEVSRMIREWNSAVEVREFSSGEELLEHYRPYQAVFLDIDMEGMNGIETGKRIRRMDTSVRLVYLTAYRDYVAGAFGVHAFQYLLKPVSEREVKEVLGEIFRYRERPEKKIILDFQTVGGTVCLSAEEIYYFEYMDRKVRICAAHGEYWMKEKIGAVARRMEPYGFSAPHKSFVVNLFHVKNVCGSEILLDNGEKIFLSQKKQKAWKQELAQYLADRLEEYG